MPRTTLVAVTLVARLMGVLLPDDGIGRVDAACGLAAIAG